MQRSCWLQLKVSIINNALVSKVWEPLNACVEYRLRWMYFGVLMISSSYFLQPLSERGIYHNIHLQAATHCSGYFKVAILRRLTQLEAAA